MSSDGQEKNDVKIPEDATISQKIKSSDDEGKELGVSI